MTFSPSRSTRNRLFLILRQRVDSYKPITSDPPEKWSIEGNSSNRPPSFEKGLKDQGTNIVRMVLLEYKLFSLTGPL